MNRKQLLYFVRSIGTGISRVGENMILAALGIGVFVSDRSYYIPLFIVCGVALILIGNWLAATTVDREPPKAKRTPKSKRVTKTEGNKKHNNGGRD